MRFVERLDLCLRERLAIHLGDQLLRDFPAHVIGEMQLDQVLRHVALAKAGQPRLPPDAAVRGVPRLLDDVRGRLDGDAALACLQILDVYFQRLTPFFVRDRARQGWCERGELNPQGPWAHWILSPARLPIPPLSRRP